MTKIKNYIWIPRIIGLIVIVLLVIFSYNSLKDGTISYNTRECKSMCRSTLWEYVDIEYKGEGRYVCHCEMKDGEIMGQYIN